MIAFEKIATSLAEAGCTLAFGVPGGGPNLDLIGALNERNINFVLAHTETGAAIMAATHGLLTEAPSAVIVTRGPGAAAVVNGATSATLDRAPLVVITDCVPQARREAIGHQRFDQRAMLRPVTLRTARVGNDVDAAVLGELIATCLGPPAGAIHIDLDATATTDVDPLAPSVEIPTELLVDADTMRATLQQAVSPVVIVGEHAPLELIGTLEGYNAPVLTTYQGAGALPEGHALLAGAFTNATPEKPLLRDADLVILVGYDDVESLPGVWPESGTVVAIDPQRIRHHLAPVTMQYIGHPAEVMTQRTDSTGREPQAHLAALRSRLADSSRPLGPIALVKAAAELWPTECVVTVDAGAHFLAVMPIWPIARRHQVLISNGLATMGYALPAAIGAATADPNRPVIAFTGDGGLHMVLSELETLQRLNLPVVVAVFNDSELTLIRLKQKARQGGSAAVAYGLTDFAAVANGMGLTATVVTEGEQLPVAFERALASGRPHLVDVRLDATEYEHILQVSRG
jgi:acetolactate synthase-1/2/3 large subunit